MVSAILLLVMTMSSVIALECPSGSLRYSSEILGKMKAEKINEEIDSFEATCTVNAADAWCYSALLLKEEHTVVFHCADASIARECAQLSAHGRFCNDNGTFCCCNNSGCKAILSYPFIKNNGTNVVPAPSTAEHEMTPDVSSKHENVSNEKNGHNHHHHHKSSSNSSTEESHHKGTDHLENSTNTTDLPSEHENDVSSQHENVSNERKGRNHHHHHKSSSNSSTEESYHKDTAHEENSTNTTDLSQKIASALGDSIDVSINSSGRNATSLNFTIHEPDKEDGSNQTLATNRSSAENLSTEAKANSLAGKHSHASSANDSKVNSTETLESKLSSETSEEAESHPVHQMNVKNSAGENLHKEGWKRSTKMHKVTHEKNSSIIAESSQEDHSRPTNDSLSQPATNATQNLAHHVHEVHSETHKVSSNDANTVSNSTEAENSPGHRVVHTEKIAVRNSTSDDGMEREKASSEQEREFIQAIEQANSGEEIRQNSQTVTKHSTSHGETGNSTIEHEQHLAEESIIVDSTNSTGEAITSNATSKKQQVLAHDIMKAEDHDHHAESSGSHNITVGKSVEESKEKMDKSANDSSASAEATEPPPLKDLCPVLPTTPCPDCSRSTTDAMSKDPEESSSACPAALSSSIEPTTVMWVMWIAPWIILLPIVSALLYLLKKSRNDVEQLTEAATATPLAGVKIAGL